MRASGAAVRRRGPARPLARERGRRRSSRFEPHVEPRPPASAEPLVWAIDTRHLPLYWFPRQCPARRRSGPTRRHHRRGRRAAARVLAAVHAIESAWLERVPARRVWSPYRLPEASFEPDPRGGRLLAEQDRGRAARAGRARQTCSPCTPSAGIELAASCRTSGRSGTAVVSVHARVQRHAPAQRRAGAGRSRRAAASSPSPGRRGKPGRSRGDLAQDEEARRRLGELAADLLRDACHAVRLRARPDPEHDGAALRDERQAPLRRDGRRRERLRDRDLVTVCCLLLGAAPDDVQVRELVRPPLEEVAPSGARPRAASPRARAARRRAGCPACRRRSRRRRSARRRPRTSSSPGQRVVEQHAPRLVAIADRRQPGRREHRVEPALEEVRQRWSAG